MKKLLWVALLAMVVMSTSTAQAEISTLDLPLERVNEGVIWLPAIDNGNIQAATSFEIAKVDVYEGITVAPHVGVASQGIVFASLVTDVEPIIQLIPYAGTVVTSALDYIPGEFVNPSVGLAYGHSYNKQKSSVGIHATILRGEF